MNARGGDGAEVIYALRGNDILPNIILNNLKQAGQNVRKAYQRRLPNNPSKDYYFIHRNTGNTEAIIVEYGFLDSKGDDVSQLKNNWQEYAESIVKAIAEYKNIPYNTNNQEYVVKKGDSLYSIAKKYNTTVEKIKAENNLVNNLLKIGQKITIPTNRLIYTVQKGDSLYSIAKNNNTTVEELMNLNKLNSNLLSIGQKIILPSNEKQTYIVKKGDSLYKIANYFNTTINDLKLINGLSSDILSIGQELFIP